MPIFPQVDMVPWGLNEMFVTYFGQNTTRIISNSTLFTLSKTPPHRLTCFECLFL